MSLSANLERYIFNCISRYEPVLRCYEENAMQEICIAIFEADSKQEALRMASRSCRKMLRQLGNRSNGVKRRYEEHCMNHFRISQHQMLFTAC